MTNYFKKLSLTMKACMVFLTCYTVNANATAPLHGTNVNVEMRNGTVMQLLNTIEEQTGFNFFFNNKHIDANRKVSVSANSKDVFEVLDKVFAGTDVSYSVVNDRIILSTKEEQAVAKATSVVTVEGVVTDASGEAIIGATVIEKGTTNGTITDFDGNFTLNLSSDKALIEVSYIGYESQILKYVPGKALKIILKEDTQTLEEVVVVGFGSQKKANLTGAVAQVKMGDVLGDRPVTNVKDALQGTMPGLTVTGGASPGSSKTFNIRGTVSINATNPLVLIDNVEGDIDLLNPEDIESVSVLKDAASSAIYGARAAAGVILITTKKAKKGDKFQLNYNNNFGFQTSINQPNEVSLDTYLNTYQNAGFSDKYYANDQSVAQWREYLTQYHNGTLDTQNGIYVDQSGIPYYLKETNQYKAFMETSFIQTHNATLSGGTEKLRYRISGGMTFNDGPLKYSNDTYTRKNLSAFLGADITNWYTQEIDIRYSTSDQKTPPANAFGSGIYRQNMLSWMPQGVMPGTINTDAGVDLPLETPANHIKYNNPTETGVGNARIFVKSIFRPIKNLELVGEYTYDRKDINGSRYANNWTYTTFALGGSSLAYPAGDFLTKNVTTYDYNALNLYGSYDFKYKENHSVKVMAGFNQERKQQSYQSSTAYEMVSSSAPSLGGGTGKVITSNTYDDFATRGAFYRVNYNYKDKYLFEANGRYDGSSKFPKNSRFGFFPSFSLGWNVTREDFMKFSENWLGEFKLRASWGQIGNQNIANYQYYAQMNPLTGGANNGNGGKNPIYWLQDGSYVTYLTAPNLISSNFTWEKVETLDLGFDASFFNNRLKTTFDWYLRTTKDMLQAGVEMPGVIGADAPMQNIANMQTKGWELSLTWRDKIGDWSYNIGANIYDHKSKITKFINTKGTLAFANGSGGTLNTYYVGQELGEIWGFVTDGFYTVDDFVDCTSWKLKDGVVSIDGISPRPGDIKYKNLSDKTGTNQINTGKGNLDDAGDRKVIGNTTPRYCYGLNLGVGYKGFNLSAMFQGVGKRDYWIGGSGMFPFGGESASYRPVYEGQTNYWQPQGSCGGLYTETDREYWIAKNDDPTLFRIYNQLQNVGYNTRVSDKYLADASYLRLKNVTLSYSFPSSVIGKYKLSALRMFVSGENLHTFTSLPDGYDPERLNWGYPFYRTVSFGLNVTL